MAQTPIGTWTQTRQTQIYIRQVATTSAGDYTTIMDNGLLISCEVTQQVDLTQATLPSYEGRIILSQQPLNPQYLATSKWQIYAKFGAREATTGGNLPANCALLMTIIDPSYKELANGDFEISGYDIFNILRKTRCPMTKLITNSASTADESITTGWLQRVINSDPNLKLAQSNFAFTVPGTNDQQIWGYYDSDTPGTEALRMILEHCQLNHYIRGEVMTAARLATAGGSAYIYTIGGDLLFDWPEYIDRTLPNTFAVQWQKVNGVSSFVDKTEVIFEQNVALVSAAGSSTTIIIDSQKILDPVILVQAYTTGTQTTAPGIVVSQASVFAKKIFLTLTKTTANPTDVDVKITAGVTDTDDYDYLGTASGAINEYSDEIRRVENHLNANLTMINQALTIYKNRGAATKDNIKLQWQGNPYLECCDRIRVQKKDGTYFLGFITKQTFNYDGALSCEMELAGI